MALLAPAIFPAATRHLRSGWLSCSLGLAALAFCGSVLVAAGVSSVNEYQVKAVFLFNFTQFVDWPPTAFVDSAAPFVIGVLGDDPFGPFLDETVSGEHVNAHPLLLQHYRRVEEIGACHILFVSRSESAQLGQILNQLKGRSTLTVSDADKFVQHGGMICLVTENNKVRMKVNPAAASAVGLTISSKLLRPAALASPRSD